jgi:hypothetical protein
VYLGVTVLVTLAGVSTFLSLDTVLLRNSTERTLAHEASVALERMVRTIRDADSIHLGLSSFDVNMGSLALDTMGTTTVFSVSNGNLTVAENGLPLGDITSDSVTVENVVYTRYTNTDTELVRVALTLSTSNKAASSTRTFFTSAVLRGSYD